MGSLEQRRRGVFLGLAVGDALGAAVEFKPRGTFEPVTGYRAGGPHRLAPGEWTDDTSMALALADSLAVVGSDARDQAERYLAWWKRGAYSVTGRCFDIGNATRDALTRIASGTPAAEGGSEADAASGNGSIMRLAPVVLQYLSRFPDAATELADEAARSSAPTHRSAKCLSACRYLAVVLAALIHGREREEVLAPDWPLLGKLGLHPSILEVARGSFRRKKAAEIRGSGYVVESLEAALWAYHSASSFEEAVLAAVNLGDDADTTGAICGQLAGAYFGAEGIPKAWLEGLARREWIEDAVSRLGLPEKRRPVATPPRYDVRSGDAPVALATADHAPPTVRCYWVVPERLLAGGYPGSADAGMHAARIEALWGAGVRTFVNLMEVGERNPQGHAMAAYEPVAASARCLRFAIPDLGVPSGEEMRRILDAIDDSLRERLPVYVHCLGGVDRTGTVVGCWLRRHGLADEGSVLSVLARMREADRERGGRVAPETAAQRAMVLGWKRDH